MKYDIWNGFILLNRAKMKISIEHLRQRDLCKVDVIWLLSKNRSKRESASELGPQFSGICVQILVSEFES